MSKGTTCADKYVSLAHCLSDLLYCKYASVDWFNSLWFLKHYNNIALRTINTSFVCMYNIYATLYMPILSGFVKRTRTSLSNLLASKREPSQIANLLMALCSKNKKKIEVNIFNLQLFRYHRQFVTN